MMEETKQNEMILKIEGVSKEYRLGMIGRTSLRDEIQRRRARRRNEADPTAKVWKNTENYGEMFLALNDISLTVCKGEAVGIIGHNGAGKSTLLKLITRVTAPTEGIIKINGRVASLLEVGTGFHPELTGRENIYLNGAILGMTKKEIAEKEENIIEFSECRKFIDTPVKRYSSGMNVKLGFSIAAHLNSEIMIMDEVLAVGDVAFQNKCIEKMREVANSGKTILYVSHNMATIRSLCDRCIVLSSGSKIFDGDVEEGIAKYIAHKCDLDNVIELENTPRPYRTTGLAHMHRLTYLNSKNGRFDMGNVMHFRLKWSSERAFDRLQLRIGLFTVGQTAVGISFSEPFSALEGENERDFTFDISYLLPGKYCLELLIVEIDEDGNQVKHDVTNREVVIFEIEVTDEKRVFRKAKACWGFVELPSAKGEDK